MKVVTDHHHSVLFESLLLLFEDRAILGPAEVVVWEHGAISSPIVPEFGRPQPRLTERAEKGDVVIATHGEMRAPMRSMAHEVGALYVDQVGNQWDEPIGPVVLRSAIGKGAPGLTYHPEFHRLPYTEPTGDRIGAFHNSLQHMPGCWDQFQAAGGVLYGTVENQLHPHEVAQARADCLAIWHCKDADGYGFGVHEAFASGRAVIGHREHYAGKLAEPLFVRGLTYLEPGDTGDLEAIGINARARFDSLVDFDAEAEAVRDYLLAVRGHRD